MKKHTELLFELRNFSEGADMSVTDRAADIIEKQAAEISRLQGLLNKLQLNGAPTRKERRAALRAQQ